MNCSADKDGGAISFGAKGDVSGCSFVNCSSARIGGAIYFGKGGSANYCIFDNNTSNNGSAIYINSGSVDVEYNFFAFQNNITDFPSNLINSIIPKNWVVLNIVKSGDEYVVKFVLNNGSDLDEFMLDYTARLNISGVVKEITIKNNTFKDTWVNGVGDVMSYEKNCRGIGPVGAHETGTWQFDDVFYDKNDVIDDLKVSFRVIYTNGSSKNVKLRDAEVSPYDFEYSWFY